MFSQISKINVSEPETWERKIFLTFDIDWAHDDIIWDCYNLVASYGIETTWFATHENDLLKNKVKNLEWGIHPNFNDQLEGQGQDRDAKQTLERLLDFVPNARSVRSHSLLSSEKLLDQFANLGLTHTSNLYLPFSSKITNAPFMLWSNLTIVPHVFQDNVALRMLEEIPSYDTLRSGFYVFNFHPIHVFLNTEHIDRYKNTRSIHHKPKELIKKRYKGYGTRDRLIELLNLART